MVAFSRVVGLVLLLAACQSVLTAEVTRFHAVNLVSGGTFTILPEPGQGGSLEFQHYADLVAGQLAARGFTPVAHSGPPADYVVFLTYGAQGSRTETAAFGDPGWSWRGWPPASVHYNTYTLYAQRLDVSMLDGKDYRAGTRTVVWQGRASADTGSRDINPAMPYLARALFQGFPGANDQTVVVDVPLH